MLIGGSGGGHAVPDALMEAVGKRFRETGAPRGITALHPVGLGDGVTKGAGHLAPLCIRGAGLEKLRDPSQLVPVGRPDGADGPARPRKGGKPLYRFDEGCENAQL